MVMLWSGRIEPMGIMSTLRDSFSPALKNQWAASIDDCGPLIPTRFLPCHLVVPLFFVVVSEFKFWEWFHRGISTTPA